MSRTRIATTLTLSILLGITSCSMQERSFQLAFDTPSQTLYTNESIALSVEVADGPFERIELVQGETVIAELTGSTTYEWDTSELDEGSYDVIARAYRGDALAEAGPVTVVVDRTPPTIAGTTPANGNDTVASSETVSITFSEAIDPDSINSDSLTLARGDGVALAASRSISSDETSVSMTTLGSPALPLELVASATNTIRDRAGNRLETGTTWKWTVPAWLPIGGPAEVEDEHRAEAASLAFDSTGTPYVAYREYVDADYRIYVSRWDGSTWEQVGGAVSSTTTGVHADVPSLAIGNLDRPVVAYEEEESSFEENVYVKRFDGGSWTQLGARIDIVDAHRARVPDLAIDQNGLPVVAWVELDESLTNPYEKLHVKRWTGSSFIELGNELNAGSDDADDPDVEISADGEVTVAWSEIDVSQGNIYYAYWTGSVWMPEPRDYLNEAEALDRSLNTGAYGPALTHDPDATVPYIAWYEAGDLYAAWLSTNYVHFRGDEILNVDSSRYADSVSIEVDSQGRPIVAWTESSLSGDDDIYVKRFENNFVLMGGPVYEGPSSGESPSLAMAANDRPYIAYSAYVQASQSSDIRVVRYNGWE